MSAPVLDTKLSPDNDQFRSNAAHNRALADTAARRRRAGGAGRQREEPRAAYRARQIAPARPRRAAARSGLAVPRDRPARRLRPVRRRSARRRDDRRHRPRVGPPGDDRLQRRHGEGRHLLSDDGQEASPRAGDRRTRTACRASIWSIRAARTCRTRPRCSPTATISGASSSTRPTCRPRASRRSPA